MREKLQETHRKRVINHMLKDRKTTGHSDVYGGFPAVLEKSRLLEGEKDQN